MTDNPKRKAITAGFNILLFLYLIYTCFLWLLFEPESDSHVPMDDFFEISPAGSMLAAVILFVVLILTGAFVIRAFWNRLVTSLFSTRELNYQEALAIILMIIIFGIFGE